MGKVRAKENQIMYMKKELEGARYSNSALLDNNSNLQVEIDSLNNHIKVITVQNEDLTRELDQFVQANEAIRERLDRKNRVEEIRARNDAQLMTSMNTMNAYAHQPGPSMRDPRFYGPPGGVPAGYPPVVHRSPPRK